MNWFTSMFSRATRDDLINGRALNITKVTALPVPMVAGVAAIDTQVDGDGLLGGLDPGHKLTLSRLRGGAMRRLVFSVALAAVMSGIAPAEALTVTVPNNFNRVCSLSCGRFNQTNGPYNPRVISVCNTYNRYGNHVQRYTLPAGSRCTP